MEHAALMSMMHRARDGNQMADRIAPQFGTTVEGLPDAPHVLLGPPEAMVEHLQRRREKFGFSYVVISGDTYEAFAPVVKQLAGT